MAQKGKVIKAKPDKFTFWVHIPIFNANLYVYVGKDFDKFKDWCLGNTTFPPCLINDWQRWGDSDATTYGYFGEAVIYADEPMKKSVLVHELLHVVLQLLRHRDVEETDDEVRCYLMGYLYEEVVEKLPKEMLE